MRTKRYISLFLAGLMALSLAGCGAVKKDKEKDGDMTIRPAQLSEEENALVELLGLELENYHMFDFQVEGTQSIHLRAYELVEGDWECVAHPVSGFTDPTGRLALTFGKMTEGVRMACRSKSGSLSMEFVMEADENAPNLIYATSTLTGSAPIELDQEIPLAIQIATTQSEIHSYDVQYFGMPREYAKYGYEHVYAITVTFSKSAPSEPLQDTSAAPKPEEPTPSPEG